MRRTSGSLVRVATTVAFAMLCAASAQAGSTDYLLELGGVEGESTDDKHKNEIEILSYSWGATRSAGKVSKVEAITIKQGTATAAGSATGGAGAGKVVMADGGSSPARGGNVEYEWKVEEGESAPPPPGGVRVAVGDVNGDGRADVVSPRDAASGLPTGKRQHKPMMLTAPLAKGSLTVRGKFPGCAVGTRYSSLALSGRGKRFTLQDAIITNCGKASGESLPMEEVSFNYAKIKT